MYLETTESRRRGCGCKQAVNGAHAGRAKGIGTLRVKLSDGSVVRKPQQIFRV